MKLDVNNLVVGDVVGIIGNREYKNKTANVSKITKTQIVVLTSSGNEHRFNRETLNEVGGSQWDIYHLVPEVVVLERRQVEDARKARNAAARKVKERLDEVIRNHSNGFGDFSGLTDEEKVELVAMINGL